MNFIYTDNLKHPVVDLDEVFYIQLDSDEDILFVFKDGTQKYWGTKTIEETKELREKILHQAGATNLSQLIKL